LAQQQQINHTIVTSPHNNTSLLFNNNNIIKSVKSVRIHNEYNNIIYIRKAQLPHQATTRLGHDSRELADSRLFIFISSSSHRAIFRFPSASAAASTPPLCRLLLLLLRQNRRTPFLFLQVRRRARCRASLCQHARSLAQRRQLAVDIQPRRPFRDAGSGAFGLPPAVCRPLRRRREFCCARQRSSVGGTGAAARSRRLLAQAMQPSSALEQRAARRRRSSCAPFHDVCRHRRFFFHLACEPCPCRLLLFMSADEARVRGAPPPAYGYDISYFVRCHFHSRDMIYIASLPLHSS